MLNLEQISEQGMAPTESMNPVLPAQKVIMRELKVGEIITSPTGKTYQVVTSESNECCGWYISMYQVGGKTKAHHSFYENNPKRNGKGWTK